MAVVDTIDPDQPRLPIIALGRSAGQAAVTGRHRLSITNIYGVYS